MAIATIIFTAAPVVPSTGRATLNITDPDGMISFDSDMPHFTSSDNGAIIDLSTAAAGIGSPATVTADPVSIGVAQVTGTADVGGVPQTVTATVTVTAGTGANANVLQAAWTTMPH
jgi:hypothetical protein